MSYELPITMITEQVVNELAQAQEEAVMKAVWRTGVDVDKDELIRALNYDRGQYDKGYADGKRDAMKWISVEERLPELGMRVIVNIKGHGKVKPYQSVWTFEDGERELWEQWVTHWMPIPDPPEVEERDQ